MLTLSFLVPSMLGELLSFGEKCYTERLRKLAKLAELARAREEIQTQAVWLPDLGGFTESPHCSSFEGSGPE